MIRAPFHSTLAVLAAGALALASACTMKSTEAPPLTGPSEFDLSIALSAAPDQLQQDGASQSLITVTARDGNAAPVRNVSLRAAMAVQGTLMDFGSLSARSLVTGNDGRAQVVYTAPQSVPMGPDNFTVVDIVITPLGTDFNNTNSRVVSIRLYPSGVVIPNPNLTPRFTMSPGAPSVRQDVLFDASTSTGPIVSYAWRFGDGGRGSNRTTTHAYDEAGTYVVTLTVTDQYGRSEDISQSINVAAGDEPSAEFTTSPAGSASRGQNIQFNASLSRAAPGRRIVSYAWDFGDGTTGSNVTTNHTYPVAGNYTITLNVTDDAGSVGTFVVRGFLITP